MLLLKEIGTALEYIKINNESNSRLLWTSVQSVKKNIQVIYAMLNYSIIDGGNN